MQACKLSLEDTTPFLKVDFAILNAGILKVEIQINETTSHKEVLQVNYLSTALLTIFLVHNRAKSSKMSKAGKLTVVGSQTAEWAKFEERTGESILAVFNELRYSDLQDRYYNPKLLEGFFVTSLVKQSLAPWLWTTSSIQAAMARVCTLK